ncbi:hypothetical protein Ddye_017870 [Dipteronia dyeriana]|uniref:Uncharacterized protein n=1 Tax=Dipteronia dyeriana TaxID=168575 RepID=A0AAD9U9I8_9ROSI|nr:hypothetical protein Ddye_017870 [Dipteronia dyeriana]
MSTMPEEPSCLSTCHFDVEKYDKRNVDERTYEDNVDEKTYEDVLSDVAGMNLETFYKKAWGTGANDVEAPALGNAGPKTPHFVVDVADMDIEVEPYFVKAWGTGANDVEAPALGNTGPKSPSFVADLAAKDSETFLERAWGTVANRVGAPALGNTGPRSQHPSFS